MALDAAGISIDQIQQDAKSRQEALDRYEAEQSKQTEVEWSRRADGNAQNEAEMERAKAHFMARMIGTSMELRARRHFHGLASEKKAGSRGHG